jgi:hypothetical protein
MVDPKVLDIVNEKVISEFPPDEKEIGILALIAIGTAIVQIVQNCPNLKQTLEKDAEKALNWFRHPTLFNKARLYLAVRHQARQTNTDESVHTIVNYILKAAPKTTKDDVLAFCEAAKLASAES